MDNETHAIENEEQETNNTTQQNQPPVHDANIKQEAEKELMSMLGIKTKDELQKVKEVYESSLTQEQKLNNDLLNLQSQVNNLTNQLNEKDVIIATLSGMSGISIDKIKTITKMAMGLKDENTSIEDAVKTVINMVNQQQTPVGKPLEQPGTHNPPAPNPFKRGEHFNMTEQAKLLREDPEKARRLAKEANYKLNF